MAGLNHEFSIASATTKAGQPKIDIVDQEGNIYGTIDGGNSLINSQRAIALRQTVELAYAAGLINAEPKGFYIKNIRANAQIARALIGANTGQPYRVLTLSFGSKSKMKAVKKAAEIAYATGRVDKKANPFASSVIH